MVFGSGNFLYKRDELWELKVKEEWDIKEVAGISIDEEDNIYVLTRVLPPIIVFSKNGSTLETFGDNIFERAHGMYRDINGFLYGVDDASHCVYKFNKDRKVVMVIGNKGICSNTGYDHKKGLLSVLRSSGPFNRPTRLVSDRLGNIYITDGYGNARVHKFNNSGELLLSWGEPGDAPGQFNTPHGIAIDKDDVVYIADRKNNRVQRFTGEGKFIDMWTNLHRPSDIWIDSNEIVYISENKRTNNFNDTPSRVSIFNKNGILLSRLGDDNFTYTETIGFQSAHGLALDSEGSIYIGNVGKKWPKGYNGLHKYRRV